MLGLVLDQKLGRAQLLTCCFSNSSVSSALAQQEELKNMLNSLYTVNRSTEPCTCEHESHHAAGRPSSHVRVACRGRGPAACGAGMRVVTGEARAQPRALWQHCS
jgi:hypothetical protein